MFYFCLVITVLFIFFSTYWVFRIKYSFRWLIFERNKYKEENKYEDKQLFILLPVLKEENVLSETINYFLSITSELEKISIIIITTEKENNLTDDFSKNTIDIASEISKKNKNILHIHYPNKKGLMSHQLNYAIKRLLTNSLLKRGDFLAVYNADSRPEKETFSYFFKYCNQANVFQQYGNYFGNINLFPKDLFRGSILFRQKKHQTLSGDELAVQTTRFVTIYR